MIWALVGSSRCGVKNALDRTKAIRLRVGGITVVIGVLIFVFFVTKDLMHLFRWPAFS